jgi:hypothetical protein
MNKDTYIGFPVYDGKVGINTIQQVFYAQHHKDSPIKGVIYLTGDSLVTRARNKTVKKFLETDGEYLLFIDSDIIFTQNDIIKLRSNDKKLCGGVYLKKKLPYSPVCNRLLGHEGELHKMGEIGTGFMLIHRDIFTSIAEKYPEHYYKNENDEEKGDYYDYFRVGVIDNRYLSEDYYFCYLARECGYDVYLDPDILVKHEGKATYPFNDNELLEGATELLRGYSVEEPLEKKTLVDMQNVIKQQMKARNYK